jgi:hypothetical protein
VGTAFDQSYTVVYRRRSSSNTNEVVKTPIQQSFSLTLRSVIPLDQSQWSQVGRAAQSNRIKTKSADAKTNAVGVPRL